MLTETVTFEGGRRSGLYTAFHPSGVVRESGKYQLGARLEDTFGTFDEQGNPLIEPQDGR